MSDGTVFVARQLEVTVEVGENAADPIATAEHLITNQLSLLPSIVSVSIHRKPTVYERGSS